MGGVPHGSGALQVGVDAERPPIMNMNSVMPMLVTMMSPVIAPSDFSINEPVNTNEKFVSRNKLSSTAKDKSPSGMSVKRINPNVASDSGTQASRKLARMPSSLA